MPPGILAPLALLTLVGQAQVPPPPPVFKSGVDLVRLDVRITDEHGAPVGDIRPDEIEIIDQGQRRPVLLFQHIEEPRGTYLEAAARTAGGEVSTNQGAPHGHLYVLMFDQEHITPGAEQRARLAAERFLRARLRPQDRVAVYGLPGPGPDLEFTADARRAIAELDKVRGGLDRMANTAYGAIRVSEAYQIARGNDLVLTRVALRASESASDIGTAEAAVGSRNRSTGNEDYALVRRLVAENARTVVAQAEGHARRFLQLATDVMLGLRRVEGRKSIILFSEGFYVDNLERELETLAAAAAQSYSVIYALDLNRRTPDISAAESTGAEQYTETQDRIEPLGSLALETDGELIVDAADRTERVLNALADASQDYYIVGFAPAAPADASRGVYRRVNIKVKRPGVRANARTGYAVGPLPTPADRRRAIEAALKAPYTQQGLRVEYTTYALRGDSPGMQRVFLVLDAETPVAVPESSQPRGGDVVFVVRDARTGSVAASTSGTMPLPRMNASGRSTGIAHYRVQFELAPGEYLMRAVVREPGGLVGSADRRFVVRATGDRDLAASDLVIGRPGDALPVRPRLYPGGVLTGALEVYGRSPQDLEGVDVRLDLEPLGTAGAVNRRTSATAAMDPPRNAPGGAARAAHFDVPLGDIVPGAYLARATVGVAGETVAEVAREVEVLEGPPRGAEPNAPAAAAGPPDTAAAAAPEDARNVLLGEPVRDLIATAAATSPERAAAEALSLAMTGNWSGAAGKVRALEQSARFTWAVFTALDRFAQQDYAAAVKLLNVAAAIEPRSPPLAFVCGWAHAAAGDTRAAIGAWRSAALLDPGLVPAHLALADAYLRLHQPALAIQALRAGLTALPDSYELRTRLNRLQRPQSP